MKWVNSFTAEPIPAGTYVAVITELEPKRYNGGARQYTDLTFQIIEGPYAGYCLSKRLDLLHPNLIEKTLYCIELSSICWAVGVPTTLNYSELYNRPLLINVCRETRPDNGVVANRIVGYAKRERVPKEASDG